VQPCSDEFFARASLADDQGGSVDAGQLRDVIEGCRE